MRERIPWDINQETVEARPTHVWIEPTSRCNSKCTHCRHFYEDFGQDMSSDLYVKISDAVLEGLEKAELIGFGEPFVAKPFDQMLDDCLSRDIEVLTTTNGIALRDDTRVAKIVRNNVMLCLSIDGARKETFEFVRPSISWESMLKTLECIRRNADAAGRDKRFRFRFNFVAMKHNIGDLPDLVRLAARYGAQEIWALHLGAPEQHEMVHDQALDSSPELVGPAVCQAWRIAQRLGVVLWLPPSFHDLSREWRSNSNSIRNVLWRAKRRWSTSAGQDDSSVIAPPGDNTVKAGVTCCSIPWTSTFFASDGQVYPCCVMGRPLGDMTTQNWEAIWNGPLYRNLRRTIHSWNPTVPCRYCGHPCGINGGNGNHHTKYFGKYSAQDLPLDAQEVQLGPGTYDVERGPDGAPTHFWMRKTASFSLPMRPGAEFLRLLCIPMVPGPTVSPGRCRVCDGQEEPFDNSYREIHLPISHVRGGRIELAIEMEWSDQIGPDPRELGLAITGFQYLT